MTPPLGTQGLTVGIFDVDGVLLASPHERAWRKALRDFADPDRFTTAMYQAEVAGKPRSDGARVALEALRVPSAAQQAGAYAERKQVLLDELIRAVAVDALPDALRFVEAVQALGWPMAVASSSKNVDQMMQPIRLACGESLLDAFGADVAAARAGGMAALGVARLGDAALLRAAGAELVLVSLDDVAMDELAQGRLRGRAA